jgi:SAM-dependent methyltransferase
MSSRLPICSRGADKTDQRTRDNAEYLDGRYRRGVPQGRYFAHAPVYGVGCDCSEGNQAVKLARTYAVFRRLSQMQFDTLLDVGGAEGWHVSLARRLFGAQGVTSDLSFEASLRARELFDVPAVTSDAHWLPFATASFDVVLCCEVLEHVGDPVAVMCEVARVARRYAVFTTEQTAGEPREREILLQLADTKSPHAELHWFLPSDFRTVLGEGITTEREVRLTERLTELYAVGLEPPETEVRNVVLDMTRLGGPTGNDNGILVTWVKGDAPPVDTSAPSDEGLLDVIMQHRLSPEQELVSPAEGSLDPFLAKGLACPACLAAIRPEAERLVCSSCGRSFEVERGVPRFYSVAGDAYPSRADRSRWPWLTDDGARLRELFTALRGAHSRLVYDLLSAELALLGIRGAQATPQVDYADSALLRRALARAGSGEESATQPRAPMMWWDRLPASKVEIDAMRHLGVNLVSVVDALARAQAQTTHPITLGRALRVAARVPRWALRCVSRLWGSGSRGARAPGGQFPDIPADFWARREIEALAQAGICGGYPDGFYRPAWGVSRGDMAVYVARSRAGGDARMPDHNGEPTFPDMPPADPAYRHVEYAVSQGIVSGYPDGLYHPEHWLDRGQAAVFIARAVAGGDDEVPAGPAQPSFPDVTSQADDSYAACYKHIEYLASLRAVEPRADGRFHPEALCTRDHMAAMLAHASGLCS